MLSFRTFRAGVTTGHIMNSLKHYTTFSSCQAQQGWAKNDAKFHF